MQILKLISVTLIASALVGCSKKRSSKGAAAQDPAIVSNEVLANVENQQLVIEVPEACGEGETSHVCESWLGLSGETVGLTHIKNRLVFSIEELAPDGTFHLAAYPDCNLEVRAKQETAAFVPAPVDVNEVDPHEAPSQFRDWNVEVDGELPRLVDGGSVAIAPPDDDPVAAAAAAIINTNPPFPECRKLVAPGPLGEPAKLLDPELASDVARWRIEFPEGGYPIFISAHSNSSDRIRLLLSAEGILTAVNAKDDELALIGIWKKLRGKLKKGFDSVEKGVADAKRVIGTNVNVEKLDSKKLFVAAALPAAKLYSAVKEQGPEVLAKANGVASEGVVYMKKGTEYAEVGANAALTGAEYIAEYVMANACYLGMMTELTASFGGVAASYELILGTGAKDFAESLRDAFNVENMIKDKNSPTYLQVMLAVKAYALHASLVSGKFHIGRWEEILFDIIFSLLAGEVKQGFTPKIMSRVANAMCKGTDEALSAAHALVSTITTSGIGEDCLEGIRAASISRYEAGEDICYAMRSEIKKSAAAAPSNQVADAWAEAGAHQACPKDPASESYQNLLEGVGCARKSTIVSGNPDVGDLAVDDAMVMTNNRYWTRTDDWFASLACAAGQVAVGMCSSGGGPDCYGKPKELLCASRAGGAAVKETRVRDIYHNYSPDIAFCPNGYVVTEFCSSGGNRDCSGSSLRVRCKELVKDIRVDYANCELKESKTWSGRLQATGVNHAMVGICASGKKPDCNKDKTVTKSAVFCPLVPASTLEGFTDVFGFYDGKDHKLSANIGDNLYGYAYDDSGFRLYSSPGTNRAPLYNCRVTDTNHMASLHSNCEGTTTLGLLGYVSTVDTGKMIWRCYLNGDHWTTTDPAECDAKGYTSKGGLWYAP